MMRFSVVNASTRLTSLAPHWSQNKLSIIFNEAFAAPVCLRSYQGFNKSVWLFFMVPFSNPCLRSASSFVLVSSNGGISG